MEDVALRVWVVIMSKGQTGEGGGRRENFAVQHQIISHTALYHWLAQLPVDGATRIIVNAVFVESENYTFQSPIAVLSIHIGKVQNGCMAMSPTYHAPGSSRTAPFRPEYSASGSNDRLTSYL